jgi:glycosyltransferase involved in cell wall biosynthesis
VATPLVSVVLAARDAEATISEAVQSVLGQS